MELNFDHIYQFWTDQSQKKVTVSSIVQTFWNYKYFTHNVRWKNIYAFVQLNHVIHPRHLYCSVMLHDTLKAFDDFKNKQKNVWSNVFWQIKVRIFWKCIQYTTQWDKKQMLKKFLLAKINGTKNAVFFLLRAPTHHSFTFNLRFLLELKHKVRLSKLYVGFSIFDFISLLLKFVFLFSKMHGLFDLKTS